MSLSRVSNKLEIHVGSAGSYLYRGVLYTEVSLLRGQINVMNTREVSILQNVEVSPAYPDLERGGLTG